jgi:glycosyltransferase involved in cell wall biosynthesis
VAPRRLLFVSYYFPPDPAIGGARWEAMAEWLRRMGHEVTVLSSNTYGTPPTEEDPDTHRSGDLIASGVLRRLLRRPPLLRSATPSLALQKPPPWPFTDVLVPDVFLLTWLPGALRAARRLLRERPIDCVVTTGPPHSAHLLALLLGAGRPAWIADFRDGWRYESLHPAWPTSAQNRLDASLERRVATSAEAVIGVTRPIAEDFRARLGIEAAHIPNGWDPGWEERIAAAQPPELEPGTVNVVHTGTFATAWRDPAPLFAALTRIADEHPEQARRLRLVLAGNLDANLKDMIARSRGLARHVGRIPRADALALQRRGDALLLLTSASHASHATGKLFEYLGAKRPIIALARDNEASRIVEETGTGVAVAPDDVEGIGRALLAVSDGSLAAAYAPHGLERYIYPGPAEAVAELVERAITRRERRSG